jgi:Flp pilus assembly protein TadD
MLRAEAMHWAGKNAAAASLLAAVQEESKNGRHILFTLGVTAARIGLFDRAEVAFTTVAAQAPGEFDVLFNLGRAAARAGHSDRAASAL